MREIAAYDARITTGGVLLQRCDCGDTDEYLAQDWLSAIAWLMQPPANDPNYFTVCFNLQEFTRALFSLLPEEKNKQITSSTDRIWHEECKVFYVNGRYLGLSASFPVAANSNIVHKREINLQALRWWLPDDAEEPATVLESYAIGKSIVQTLDRIGFHPTKLTSPVAVFQDNYLGDTRNLPTVYNWPEEQFEAMQYAEEMMRYEWRGAYQVGQFPNTHLFDLTSAYPAMIARLPSTTDCRCEHSTTRPDWATWGLVRGEVEVTADVSPLVYDDGDGNRINPKGKWFGTFTLREIDWLTKWGAGTFKMMDGWFFKFSPARPYEKAMNWLYALKSSPDPQIAVMAKRMSVGVSGKLDEDRQDGKKGDLYNPILAAIVRSEIRLTVGNFIYNHNLQDSLVAVQVDSVLATSPVPSIPTTRKMGAWRYEGESEALVLSKGRVWRPGKRPQGIGYEDLVRRFNEKPDSAYYEFRLPSGTLRSIDLTLDSQDLDREFEHYPESGKEVLDNTYPSKAVIIE